jgi:RNA polymerase sigma-70 factor (ECF subfamily)
MGGDLKSELSGDDGITKTHLTYGEKEAFATLFNTYKSALYRFTMYLTNSQNEAEDLFQETWYKMVKYYSDLKNIKNFKACLFAIASNIYRDMLRKKKIHRMFSFFQETAAAENGHEQAAAAYALQSDDISECVEFELSLRRAVSLLTPKQRKIFILKEIEGYKHYEISNILNIAVGTVKAQLHRAHKKLQKEMAEFLDEPNTLR